MVWESSRRRLSVLSHLRISSPNLLVARIVFVFFFFLFEGGGNDDLLHEPGQSFDGGGGIVGSLPVRAPPQQERNNAFAWRARPWLWERKIFFSSPP
jgi:hypothetical protein